MFSRNLIRRFKPGVVCQCIVGLSLGVGFTTGCTTAPSAAETAAVQQLEHFGGLYRPEGQRPALYTLSAESGLSDYVRFAAFNHPQVEADYNEWRASVAAITPARSLPDPQFTFEADLSDTLMTFMPGVMFDFMKLDKRIAMGREAAARSTVAYRNFAATVVRTAAEVRRVWVELAYVDEASRLYSATIHNVEQSLGIASAGYSTGRGMGSLESIVRLENLIAEHHVHHAALGDRLAAARTRFKAALGLAWDEADPPWPQPLLAATILPSEEELWRTTQEANPGLATMRAMVAMTVAEVEVAQQARRPDFGFGAMVDLRASPFMLRPVASISLPIWRDKIAATIAAAEARRDAAANRIGAEQLDLAAELARMLFMVREADRMIAYIDFTALPNADRLVAFAEVSYQAGMGQPTMIPDSLHMALTMRLERASALRERELAATELLVIVAGQMPARAPLLANISHPAP